MLQNNNLMNNKLKGLVIRCLSNNSSSGYSLIKKIYEETGWKPSYGSIYPLLEHLNEDKLVTFKEVGRKKVYSLTKKGKNELKNKYVNLNEVFDNIKRTQKIISKLYGLELNDDFLKSFINSLSQGKKPLKQIIKNLITMRKELARISDNNLEDKYEKEINIIICEATKKLKRLT